MRKNATFASSDWVKGFRRQLIGVMNQILASKQQMMLAAWEGSVRGRWPHEEYIKLTGVQEDMIAVFSQVCDVE